MDDLRTPRDGEGCYITIAVVEPTPTTPEFEAACEGVARFYKRKAEQYQAMLEYDFRIARVRDPFKAKEELMRASRKYTSVANAN